MSPGEGEDLSMGSVFNRRDLMKRAAAAGLVAAPTATFLTSCASGGDDKPDKVEEGTKSDKNPLAVNESAGLEVVIFDGGFGEKYAKDAEALFNKSFPKVKIKHSATQKIQSTLQPRFNGGTPPDLIDN